MSENPGEKDFGTLPWICLLCGKTVSTTHKFGDGLHGQEIGQAVHFMSYGNWGSTLWDPLDDGMRLETVICDECLKPLLGRVYVCRGRREYVELAKELYTAWDKRQTEIYKERLKDEALRADKKKQREAGKTPQEGV